MKNRRPKPQGASPSKFRTGALRFSEWQGLWKFSSSDPDVGEDEYEQVARELDHLCRKKHRETPQYPRDFYARGDFTSDRTQVVEINNPNILDLLFIKDLQEWLAGKANWRIIIPTYCTKKEVIVVYPDCVRISPKYETRLALGIRSIASNMEKFGRSGKG